MSDSLPTVRLKIDRRSGHPWIFQKMVEKPFGRVPPGTVVDVEDRSGTWCGRGFYNGHSRIALRILTADRDEPVDAGFFEKRIASALSLRKDVLNLEAVTDAYRVVHSEADGLSGLVVDRFGSTVVVEFFAAGMYRIRETIHAALVPARPRRALSAARPCPPRICLGPYPHSTVSLAGSIPLAVASPAAHPRPPSNRLQP